jgi:hypothetical protein
MMMIAAIVTVTVTVAVALHLIPELRLSQALVLVLLLSLVLSLWLETSPSHKMTDGVVRATDKDRNLAVEMPPVDQRAETNTWQQQVLQAPLLQVLLRGLAVTHVRDPRVV